MGTGDLSSRVIQLAEWSKREIAVADAISEAANGQIMEGLAEKLYILSLLLREIGNISGVSAEEWQDLTIL